MDYCKRRLFGSILLSLAVGCGEGFVVHKGEPTLVGKLAGSKTYTQVDGADPLTFHSLQNAKDAKAIYAADAKGVFIGMNTVPMLIEGAEPKSFRILTPDGSYTCDHERVFWFGLEIATADPASFEPLTPPFACDSESVYVGTKQLRDCDPESFEVVKVWGHTPPIHAVGNRLVPMDDGPWIVCWSKDHEHYYWADSLLEGADYNTLAILNQYFARDKEHVFFKGKVVAGADPETFSVQGRGGMAGKDRFRKYDFGGR